MFIARSKKIAIEVWWLSRRVTNAEWRVPNLAFSRSWINRAIEAADAELITVVQQVTNIAAYWRLRQI
jgi:hypothetical protein